jgi:hypothetical protein
MKPLLPFTVSTSLVGETRNELNVQNDSLIGIAGRIASRGMKCKHTGSSPGGVDANSLGAREIYLS